MKYYAIFDSIEFRNNISIAIKDLKYFWHVSAIFCAMWVQLNAFYDIFVKNMLHSDETP